jgi:hypothetical protein
MKTFYQICEAVDLDFIRQVQDEVARMSEKAIEQLVSQLKGQRPKTTRDHQILGILMNELIRRRVEAERKAAAEPRITYQGLPEPEHVQARKAKEARYKQLQMMSRSLHPSERDEFHALHADLHGNPAPPGPTTPYEGLKTDADKRRDAFLAKFGRR